MEQVLTAEEPQQQHQGLPGAPELSSFITLMVTPQDALVLKLAREAGASIDLAAVSYTHLRAHETPEHLVCRLLLEKKKTKQ